MSSGWPTANVCSTAKRGSLDRNRLLAASNLPLWPFRLEGTGRVRGLTWFDKKSCVMQSCLTPFFSTTPSNPFTRTIFFTFLLTLKKKEQLLEPTTPFFSEYIRLLLQASKSSFTFSIYAFHCKFCPTKRATTRSGPNEWRNISRKHKEKKKT